MPLLAMLMAPVKSSALANLKRSVETDVSANVPVPSNDGAVVRALLEPSIFLSAA